MDGLKTIHLVIHRRVIVTTPPKTPSDKAVDESVMNTIMTFRVSPELRTAFNTLCEEQKTGFSEGLRLLMNWAIHHHQLPDDETPMNEDGETPAQTMMIIYIYDAWKQHKGNMGAVVQHLAKEYHISTRYTYQCIGKMLLEGVKLT